jgi:hypothetical protein
MVESKKRTNKRKRTISFLYDIIKVLEKYPDFDQEILQKCLQMIEIEFSNIMKSEKQTTKIEIPSEIVQSIYTMSREDLVKFLDNPEHFPTVSHLKALAKALHIKNVGNLSKERLKQKIIFVVYDKPHELQRILGSTNEQSSKDQILQ